MGSGAAAGCCFRSGARVALPDTTRPSVRSTDSRWSEGGGRGQDSLARRPLSLFLSLSLFCILLLLLLLLLLLDVCVSVRGGAAEEGVEGKRE